LKKGYQPRTNIVQDEKGDLVADSHSVLVGWRKRLSQLFFVYGLEILGNRNLYNRASSA